MFLKTMVVAAGENTYAPAAAAANGETRPKREWAKAMNDFRSNTLGIIGTVGRVVALGNVSGIPDAVFTWTSDTLKFGPPNASVDAFNTTAGAAFLGNPVGTATVDGLAGNETGLRWTWDGLSLSTSSIGGALGLSAQVLGTTITSLGSVFAYVPKILNTVVDFVRNNVEQELIKQQIEVKSALDLNTMGRVDVVLTDKTGTLTKSKMTLWRAMAFYHGDLPSASNVSAAKFLDKDQATDADADIFADLGWHGKMEDTVAQRKNAGRDAAAAAVQRKLDAGRRYMEEIFLATVVDVQNRTANATSQALIDFGMKYFEEKDAFKSLSPTRQFVRKPAPKDHEMKMPEYMLAFNSKNKYAAYVFRYANDDHDRSGKQEFRLVVMGALDRLCPTEDKNIKSGFVAYPKGSTICADVSKVNDEWAKEGLRQTMLTSLKFSAYPEDKHHPKHWKGATLKVVLEDKLVKQAGLTPESHPDLLTHDEKDGGEIKFHFKHATVQCIEDPLKDNVKEAVGWGMGYFEE